MRTLGALSATLVAACCLGLTASPVHAFSCAGPLPGDLERAVRSGYGDFYTFAFIGVPRLVRPVDTGPVGGKPEEVGRRTPIDFEVEAALHGQIPEVVTVATGEGFSDSVRFTLHRRYVVIAYRNSDGTFATNACTPTREVSPREAARLVHLTGATWTARARVQVPGTPSEPEVDTSSILPIPLAIVLVAATVILIAARFSPRRIEG